MWSHTSRSAATLLASVRSAAIEASADITSSSAHQSRLFSSSTIAAYKRSEVASFSATSSTSQVASPPPPPAFRKRRRRNLLGFMPVPTAQEAVNNILYNTPTPPSHPAGRHILNCLVTNEPGVLSRVSGILAARGFNIDSLVVAKTEVPDLSRMTIVLQGQGVQIEQARRQLEDLVPVWAVLDYTSTKTVERELLLVKVSTIPGHHIEEMTESEAEEAEEQGTLNVASSGVSPLLASSLQRTSLRELSDLFRARIVDVATESIIVELCAKSDRVDAFLKLLKPYGIIEASRSGMMAMPRSIIDHDDEPEVVEEDNSGAVDATMLPPG